MNEEIIPPRPGFDPRTLSTPVGHSRLYEATSDYIILPRGALCGVVGLKHEYQYDQEGHVLCIISEDIVTSSSHLLEEKRLHILALAILIRNRY